MSVTTALVVVVYNHYCGDSVTCKTIAAGSLQPDIVLIVDNSTREMDNQSCCEKQGWMYHSMGGNAGLTKAYNAAISLLQNQTDLIIWADDDTNFPADYMQSLVDAAKTMPDYDIFLPVVKSKTITLSPAIYTRRGVMSIKELSDLENQQITAINSGMAVRLNLYDDYRYDESMFLDYVDHDFMCWCNLNCKKIHVMEDVLLFQNYFAESNPPNAARKHRMHIFCNDIRIFDAKRGKLRILTELDLLRFCSYQYFKMFTTWWNETANKKTTKNGG